MSTLAAFRKLSEGRKIIVCHVDITRIPMLVRSTAHLVDSNSTNQQPTKSKSSFHGTPFSTQAKLVAELRSWTVANLNASPSLSDKPGLKVQYLYAYMHTFIHHSGRYKMKYRQTDRQSNVNGVGLWPNPFPPSPTCLMGRDNINVPFPSFSPSPFLCFPLFVPFPVPYVVARWCSTPYT